LKLYGNSLIKALSSIYLEFEWKPWKFSAVSKTFWDNEDNVHRFMYWISDQMGIQKFDDWYSISTLQFKKLGGSFLLEKKGGLLQLLSKCYPSHQWDGRKFNLPTKSQGFLYNIVKGLFPEFSILQDHWHPKLLFSESKHSMQLDVYVPELELAFEYQGEPHYMEHFIYGDPKELQKRDEEKKKACQREGISLIWVPFWWDQRRSSLIATIHKVRPDLISKFANEIGEPIPEHNPLTHR
jgi:hypothetical protein